MDTHVWLWSQIEPERIGPETQERLLDASQSLTVATISTLEIARLVWGGRVELGMGIQDWIERAASLMAVRTLELCHRVAVESYLLQEPFHRDPADRVLVATARVHGLKLFTADQRILEYPHVSTHDARL